MEAMERLAYDVDDHVPLSSSFDGGLWSRSARNRVDRRGGDDVETAPVETLPAKKERVASKDAIGLYLVDIRRYRLLTREEEVRYARAASAGDREARDVLITRNLRLVVSIAKRYQGLGLAFGDLIEEGNLGLMRSVERFDWKRGLRFSTYASKWIRQGITRSLANKSRTVRIPSNVLTLIRQISQLQLSLWQREGRRISNDDICQHLRISRNRLAEVHGLTQSTLSLDYPVDPVIGRHKLHDILPAEDAADPADSALRALEGRHVSRLLDALSPRERLVLRLRFGFDGDDARSLEETGKVLGVTRERIRQIEGRALAKLRACVTSAEWSRAASAHQGVEGTA
ncbi:MAG: RNA polymerase sigma factor RpoD/SigA [bacterium]